MPKNTGKNSRQPSYMKHRLNGSRVCINGKDYYLGEYDSPESWAKYYRFLAEYSVHGKVRNSFLDSESGGGAGPVTVAAVVAAFRKRNEKINHGKPVRLGQFKGLCDLLEEEYGDLPAKKFRPKHLMNLRGLMVIDGNSRKYVNEQVNRIKSIFRYAGGQADLISPKIAAKLDSVESLKRGEKCEEGNDIIPAEPKKRPTVDIDIVRATLPELSPMHRAMVIIQMMTGMRPDEVCAITPEQIDRKGDVWMYRPHKHKTMEHVEHKAVPIVGDARRALEPFLLNREPTAFCFSPKEGREWWLQQRNAARKTAEGQGNFRGSRAIERKDDPKRAPGDRYNKDTYNRAIARAANRAGVPKWTPYSLRHNAATIIAEVLGIEHVKAILGHTNLKMSEYYARQSEAKAVEAAEAMPRLFTESA